MPRTNAPEPRPQAPWTFLTNHAHVLLCIARDPLARVRDVAARVGITERAVQRIIGELEEGGYVTHSRDGRRNRYSVDEALPLRHAIERHRKVSELIALAEEPEAPPPAPSGRRSAPKPKA